MGVLTDTNPFVKSQEPPTNHSKVGDTWDGLSIEWQYDLEHGLRIKHPGDVELDMALRWVWSAEQPTAVTRFEREELPMLGRVITYRHRGLSVLGRPDLVPVRIEFHQYPTYDCYNLAWHDYPRVFADPGAASKHRMPEDDALCLYFPWDPPERRWQYENGLVQLFDIVADHLHKELWWRHTGGPDGGDWLGEDADHGFPERYAAWPMGGIAL